MTMGQGGMSEMATMTMPQPANAISMVGGKGPHGMIEMGGMFTVLKIREKLAGDAGWYKAPSMASEATAEELSRDDIAP